MAKTYRALVGFTCPADPESLKKRQQALKAGPGEKADALNAEVEWMYVKKGEKVVPFSEAILDSWLANEIVEEVKTGG
jgi:SH3-like domain-containing protein